MPRIQTTKVFAEINAAVAQGYTVVSLQGSARSSKTYNTLIWLIMYCLRHPGTRLSVVRHTRPALKGSALIDFKEILQERLRAWKQSSMNQTDLIYTFDNGSWAEFISTDDEQKLRGRKRDILFVNEANEIDYMSWQQLKMRTTRFSILDYNPSFSEEHWINGINADGRTYHFITTYRDNPFLEQTVINEIESLKERNPSLWRIYGLGQRALVEGLVFPAFVTIDHIPYNVRRRWIGVDFGYSNDPTAIVEVGVDGKNLYLDEIIYRTEMLSSDIIAILKQEAAGMKIISESADPRLIQEIYRSGADIHPVQKYPGSVEAGLSKMQEYKIHVTKRSYNLIKELRNYTYRQDKEGKYLNLPVDMFNHAVDAARYVVMNEIMGGRPRKIDVGRLQRMV